MCHNLLSGLVTCYTLQTEPVEDGTKVVDLDGDVMDHTEEGHQSLVADRLKETMAKAYHWTTSAQRHATPYIVQQRAMCVIMEPLIKDTLNKAMHLPIEWQYIIASKRGQPL